MRKRNNILTMLVDITTIDQALNLINSWCKTDNSYYVCVSNVHMCIETYNDSSFQSVVNKADLVVPDGRPIYWAQKLLGAKDASQVRGMDLTLALCKMATEQNLSIGFYGGEENTVNLLQQKLVEIFPSLNISLAISPPFRTLSEEEKLNDIETINNSKTDILFIGLGCPKQENWMADHKGKLHCVMLGVGAAFDFIAGNKKQAPDILQTLGMEWLYRLLSEPKRLWRRYLSTNPKFLLLFLMQLSGKKFDC